MPENSANAASGSWQARPGAADSDPLAESLAIILRRDKRPVSPQALCAGLPLVEGRLTPELFLRAAERAGCSARVLRRPLAEIPKLVLPAVLLLEHRSSCVLVALPDADHCTVIQPEAPDAEITLDRAALERSYSGYAIFVRPLAAATAAGAQRRRGAAGHWFWDTMQKLRKLYLEVIVASLLINLFALAAPLFVMNVYDRVVPNAAIETLWVLAVGVSIVYLFDFLMKTLRTYFVDAAGRHADVAMSSGIFEHVMDLQLAARPGSIGSFANQLQEFESFRDFFTSATLTTLIDLPFIVIFLLVVFAIGGPVAWIPLAAIPVVVGIGLLAQFPLRQVIAQTFKAATQKHAVLIEMLSGLESVKTLRAQGNLQRQWEAQIGQLARLGQRSRLLSGTAVNFSMLVQQLAYVGVVILGVYLIRDGELTMGGLIACTILTGRALMPMAQVTQLLVRYQQSLSAFRSIDRIMQLPVERPPERNFISRPLLDGAIEFKEVSFSYPGQPLPALNNVSFRIAPGERVGIIGRIGSGKTTVQKLVLGLYAPTSGSVLIDGIDLRQLDPVELRGNIGYVPQDIVLFQGTLRSNITFGAPPLDDASVMLAADIAGIGDHVRQLPNGLDFPVGERGAGLSGGQRQAVAIARAVLMHPPILLLDEPTNSLDNSTEERFKQRLTDTLGKSTLLLVTHKATPLSLVDRLLVLDQGRLVADGPREKILQALAGGQIAAARRPAG